MYMLWAVLVAAVAATNRENVTGTKTTSLTRHLCPSETTSGTWLECFTPTSAAGLMAQGRFNEKRGWRDWHTTGLTSTTPSQSTSSTATTLITTTTTPTTTPTTTTTTSTTTVTPTTTSTSITTTTPSTTTSTTTTTPTTTTTTTMTTTTGTTTTTTTTTSPPVQCTFAREGGFEDVPDSQLYQQGITAADWTISGRTSFESNTNNAYTTPYGQKYVCMYGSSSITDTTFQTLTLDPTTAFSLTYSYRIVFADVSLGTCVLRTTYGTQVIDEIVLNSGTVWTDKSVTFKPSTASSSALTFTWDCSALGAGDGVDILLDNISMSGTCSS